MKIAVILLYAVLLAAAVVTGLLIRRRENALSGGKTALIAGVFCVLLSVDTFFLCFAFDMGILPVPAVLVISFFLLLFLFRRANGNREAGDGASGKRKRGKLSLPKNTRAMKRFFLSSGSVALAVVIAVLVNLIATSLNDKLDLNLDLTAGKMYSISDDTEETLSALSDDVTITVLMSEDDMSSSTYGKYVQVLLDKYEARSNRLKVTYIDPYKNPSAVEAMSDLSDDVSEGSIVVQNGDRVRVVTLTDCYETSEDSSSGYTYVTAFRGESALTSAILSVTSEDVPKAYLLQGHNESVSDQFRDMLETSGYTVGELTLAEKSIPKKASLLILSLPQKDYTEKELNALDDYVKNGGDLLVFDGTECPTDLDNLYSWLKEWNITVTSNMVLDSEYNLSDARYILAKLSDSDSNSGLSAESDQVIVTPDAKALTVDEDSGAGDRTAETLLSSRSSSYARKIDSGTTYDSYDKQSGDKSGTYALAALAEYTGNEDGGQIMVCSSALMMTDQLMQSSSLLNRDFLSNTVSVMQPDVEVVSLSSRSMDAEPLTLSTTATYIVFLILLFIPVFLFFWGIAVFLRRRRL